MSLPFRLHPLAEDDLVAAWTWYEEQVPGLGDRFLDVVRTTIEAATEWPGSGSPVVHDVDGTVVERRTATVGFPYALRYREIDGTIVVMAVHHQRRHPASSDDREP